MTPRELIRETAIRFHQAGIDDPETDASFLLFHLTGKPPLNLRLDNETDLSTDIRTKYETFVISRLQRIPLQYIIGETSFYHRIFQINSHVLIPRPETELLCEWALDLIRDMDEPHILDLCCGSGCIGLTLKAERPDSVLWLSDVSPEALKLTAVNAHRFNLQVSLLQSDLFDQIDVRPFQLIVSNPPYIASEDCKTLQPEVMHEPLLALDGGPDGLDFYRRIAHDASEFLVPGGLLLMEVGYNEADTVSGLLASCGFSSIRIKKDYSEIDRMILARKP